LSSRRPGNGSRFPSSVPGSSSRPLSTARRSRVGLSSMKLAEPGSRQPNRTSVTEPNVSWPPLRSRSM